MIVCYYYLVEAIIFIPLLSAAAVFPIWVLEQFLPASWLIEEVVKFMLVGYVIKTSGSRSRYSLVLATGLAFSLSEALFYLFNYLPEGSLLPFFVRLTVTVPMHLATFFLLYLGFRKGIWFGLVALALSVGLHYWFNLVVAGLVLR